MCVERPDVQRQHYVPSLQPSATCSPETQACGLGWYVVGPLALRDSLLPMAASACQRGVFFNFREQVAMWPLRRFIRKWQWQFPIRQLSNDTSARQPHREYLANTDTNRGEFTVGFLDLTVAKKNEVHARTLGARG